MAPQGEQAGSAYVPVRPDMRNFHREIESELRRVLGPLIGRFSEQAGREFGRGFGDGTRREQPFEPFEREQQEQRRRQRREGEDTAGAFAQSFERQLRRAAQQLPRITIDADSSDADRTLAELRGRMERLSRARVGVDVSAEDAMRELAEIQAALQQAQNGAEVNVRMDIAAALSQIERFQSDIDRLDRQDVEVDVDTERADRSLLSLSSAGALAGAGLRGLGKAAGLVKFVPLAAQAGLAAAGLVQVVSALAPLAGLAAALPALIAGKVIALKTLQLALVGVGDAMTAAVTGTSEEFTKSLEKLSPAARSVAVEMRRLRPELVGIQQAAQQGMFVPLRGQLTAVVRQLAGPVRTGVRQVSREFGLAGRSVAGFARESRTAAAVRTLFGGVARAVAAIRPAIVPVARGVRDFAAAGASSLGRFASAAAKVGTRFGEWLSAMGRSGQVGEWISGALAVARQLGGVLSDVGGIVKSIFSSMTAAGGGALGILGQALNEINAFLKTAEGSQALTSLFTGITAIGRALAPLVPLAGHVVAELVQGLLPIVVALTPVIGVLVSTLGMVVRAITPILVPLGLLIAQLISGLLPVLQPVIGRLQELTRQAIGRLAGAIMQSLPSLLQLGQALIGLLPALVELAPLMLQWITAFTPLIPPLAELTALLVTALVPVIRVLIAVLSVGLAGVLGVVSLAVRILVLDIQGIMTVLRAWGQTASSWLYGVVIPAFRAVGAAAMWLWTVAIGPSFRAIGAAATWLWQSAIQPAFRGIATVGKWLYSIIAVAVVGPILLALAVLKVTVMALWTVVFSPIFRLIGGLVMSVWRGLIRPALTAFVGFLRNQVAPAVRWLYTSVIRPVWSALGSAIRSVWTSTVRPAFDAIAGAVRGLGGKFRSSVDAIRREWDKLRSAARTPVGFVINTVYNKGLVRLWNAVASKVPGVAKLSPIEGFARGGVVDGVLPGYTPGRDIFSIPQLAFSGGESIMRPEFTRAAGEDWVHGMNSIARTRGAKGVVQALQLAGDPGAGLPASQRPVQAFALGGIVNGFLGAAKTFFAKGLVKTARAAFNPLLNVARNAIGGTPFGDLALGVPRMLMGNMLKAFGPMEERLGGPGRRAVEAARTQVAKRVPYVWGGTSWDVGLDCSGLIQQAWKRADPLHRTMPRTTYAQRPWLQHVTTPRLGDIGQPHPGHEFMYSGNGRVIEAPYTGANVREVAARPAWWGRVPWSFDTGGWLEPGISTVANYTRQPEAVLTQGQFRAMAGAAALKTGVGRDGVTYNVYARTLDMTVRDLERLQQRQETLARIGRPR